MVKNESSEPEILGRSVVAGVAGTVVMTVFQKLAEMPLTGRPDSYAPAELVEKAFRIHPQGAARWRLNNATHLALGTMWGAAYGVAARAGLRGPRAVAVVFGTVYTGDIVLNTRSDSTDRASGPVRTGPSTSSTSWSRRQQPVSSSTGCWTRPARPLSSQRVRRDVRRRRPVGQLTWAPRRLVTTGTSEAVGRAVRDPFFVKKSSPSPHPSRESIAVTVSSTDRGLRVPAGIGLGNTSRETDI